MHPLQSQRSDAGQEQKPETFRTPSWIEVFHHSEAVNTKQIGSGIPSGDPKVLSIVVYIMNVPGSL